MKLFRQLSHDPKRYWIWTNLPKFVVFKCSNSIRFAQYIHRGCGNKHGAFNGYKYLS